MTDLWNSDLIKINDALHGKMRLVGGCVRDYLLKRSSLDYDVAMALFPQEGKAALERAGICVRTLSEKHGVLQAIFKERVYEIAALREDLLSDGNHADVRYISDYRLDAKRRDFTINALSMDQTGKIYDYFNGQLDLQNKKIRFIGDPEKRIREDFIRILRYIRFWSFFGSNKPDIDIVELCHTHRQGLLKTSIERRQKEFLKILMSPRVIETLYLMEEMGLLSCILKRYDIHRLELFLQQNLDDSCWDRVAALSGIEGISDWHLSRRNLQKVQNFEFSYENQK